jgi:nitrate reductase NapE component
MLSHLDIIWIKKQHEIILQLSYKKGSNMKDKINTFLALMIHFFAILCIGEGVGEFIISRKVTWCTWLNFISCIVFICLYAYISFKSDIKRNE